MTDEACNWLSAWRAVGHSALLTAGWVSDKFRAARVKLRSAMISSNTRGRIKSSVRKLGSATARVESLGAWAAEGTSAAN